jgi:hypothetical protein
LGEGRVRVPRVSVNTLTAALPREERALEPAACQRLPSKSEDMAFSIKQLLFSMAVVAFGLVALFSEDKPLLGRLFDLLTLGILIGMAYAAWLSTGESRAFRLGFLCWGALYFLLFKKIFDVGLADLMSRAFRGLLNLVWGASGGAQNMTLPEPVVFSERGVMDFPYPNFFVTCHSLLLLLIGVVGGWVTIYFYRKRQRMLSRRSD